MRPQDILIPMRLISSPSPNFGDRPAAMPIDILLFHYTGMPTAAGALARLRDPAAKVSAHYLVDENGDIHALVPEEKRAWHAGASYWAGESDINSRSIGIEIVNPGHEFGYRDFPDAQIAAVEELSRRILARHSIPPSRVLGHSDVAPERKEDPGELFPWARLARAGIGVWLNTPETATLRPMARARGDDPARLMEHLAAIGYRSAPATDETAGKIITAFQRHWLPAAIGSADEGRTTPQTVAAASQILSAMRRADAEYVRAASGKSRS
jgi:N-acetylmuramoyl-L-alanine amidase